MNNKEIGRFKIMQELHNKTLKQKEAGLELSLSIRQIKRLYKRYKKNGIKGLISKKRGNPSNNQLSQQIKEKTLMLIKKNYIDFGPTFAHEKLIEKHKLSISVTSVRNLMICNHIWQSKKLKKRRVFQLRERRHSIGDLIQIDGSIHDWFEGRAPKCTLLSYIDDATGKIMELKFVHAETVWNYMNTTKNYLIKHGRPIAFYSDKHGVFKVNKPSLGETLLTQFGSVIFFL